MASTRTQEHRPIAINTALEKDVLLFRRATVNEQLGRPFQIDVELLSEEPDVDFSKIVGTNATIRLLLRGGQTRYFNGFVSRFVHTGGSARTAYYRMTLSPWLWFLTRASDCRIFQNMKAPDIILKMFRDRGFSDFENSLKGTYVQRENTVQYRETDFNFVSRLMEEEGIYYYWDHANGKHTMVLADEYASHAPFPGYSKIPYYPYTQADRTQEYVWDWIVEQQIQPGHYSVTDYNFKQPTQAMDGKGDLVRQHAQPDFDMFDFPGGHQETADAEPRAKIRLGEFQAEHETVRGRGDVRGLATGFTFTLDSFPRDSQNKEYLVTGAVHELESDDYDSVGEVASDAPPYRVAFTALLATQQYRPRRITPKPLIAGPQTAFVVGPDGEEIHTDKYGRVKVQFHWDRNPDKAKDEELSCWMRVAQVWAGKGWGAVFLPRVGHEVVVEFLEGDPDRPLVTGSVYNGGSMPPYSLPENKTQSTIKSNSSKGSGGFNEIRLEDKKGDEQIFMYAQKDHHLRVKNDVKQSIGGSFHRTVAKDQFYQIKGARNDLVGGDHLTKVGAKAYLKVADKMAIEITGQYSITAKAGIGEKVTGNHQEDTSGDYFLKTGGTVVIQGAGGISLICGGNNIVIDSTGVTIKGTKITLDGSMVNIASGPGASPASGTAVAPDAPKDPAAPEEADTADPGEMTRIKARQRSITPVTPGSTPVDNFVPPTPGGGGQTPPPPEEEKTWFEFEVVDADDKPVASESVKIIMSDGKELSRKTNSNGIVRIDNVDESEVASIELTDRINDEWNFLEVEDPGQQPGGVVDSPGGSGPEGGSPPNSGGSPSGLA